MTVLTLDETIAALQKLRETMPGDTKVFRYDSYSHYLGALRVNAVRMSKKDMDNDMRYCRVVSRGGIAAITIC